LYNVGEGESFCKTLPLFFRSSWERGKSKIVVELPNLQGRKERGKDLNI